MNEDQDFEETENSALFIAGGILVAAVYFYLLFQLIRAIGSY